MDPTAFSRDSGPDEGRTVTLSGRHLREAIRLLSHLVGTVGVSRLSFTERAKRNLSNRHKRVEIFGKAMFGEPAWDVMLILYIERKEQSYTIARLTERAGAPATTVLRWLDHMEREGLVRRLEHPTDARALFVELTDYGEQMMDSYFSETLTAER